MTPIYIATEDVLSEAVADRLVSDANQGLEVYGRMGRRGNAYLRKRLPEHAKVARTFPVFMLTDLDRIECSPKLKTQWLGMLRLPNRFLFRVAVRGVEAWPGHGVGFAI
jgi:hypothetical protein